LDGQTSPWNKRLVEKLAPELADPTAGNVERPRDRAGALTYGESFGQTAVTFRQRFQPRSEVEPGRGRIRRREAAVLDHDFFPNAASTAIRASAGRFKGAWRL
jgi:hypothetical protein